MKKNLFILAAAALAFAACSNDELVESVATSDSNAINFRPFTSNLTRSATDITVDNLPSFNVTAFTAGTHATAYINDVTYTGSGTPTTYNSSKKYYWPDGNLDFYAYYWNTSLTGVSKTDYRTFVVTPAVTSEIAGNQIDLIYAAANAKNKTDGVNGLPINFGHTGSKVALKVTHSAGTNDQVYFEVKAWAVGYLDNSGTFTFPTDGAANTYSGTISDTYWTNNTDQETDMQIYRSTELADAVIIGPATDSPTGAVTSYTFPEEMILVPQGSRTSIPLATKYQGTASGQEPQGTFVAVKMAIKNLADNSVIQDETWAMWPAPVNWIPGYKYTYNVTIDNGGYFETNSNDGDDDLDPILEGAVIYFAGVTVSPWIDAVEIPVTLPAANMAYGTNYTFNNENLAEGTQVMDFNIGGLDGNKYIKVTKGGTDATQVTSAEPELNTVTAESASSQTIRVTLNANAGVAKTMTITIQEYNDAEGNTPNGDPTVITINQAAS